MDDTFIIGDVHGHLDRLEALLKQEGLLDRCAECDGAGLIPEHCGRAAHENVCECEVDCLECHGLGWARQRKDVTVVQLGDLGHFGRHASPMGDILCYKYAYEGWVDIVLWGNHDRALVDSAHAFTGYLPNHEVKHFINNLRREDRMKLAYEAHGFLITHAGLAMAFRDQKLPAQFKSDPAVLANWLNEEDAKWLIEPYVEKDSLDWQAVPIRDAIGHRRNGFSPAGGILWRDIQEKLYDGFRQIFGHSADIEKHQVRYCWRDGSTRNLSVMPSLIPEDMVGLSYCIDIGGKPGHDGADCLAGIWLPSEKIVRVDL